MFVKDWSEFTHGCGQDDCKLTKFAFNFRQKLSFLYMNVIISNQVIIIMLAFFNLVGHGLT